MRDAIWMGMYIGVDVLEGWYRSFIRTIVLGPPAIIVEIAHLWTGLFRTWRKSFHQAVQKIDEQSFTFRQWNVDTFLFTQAGPKHIRVISDKDNRMFQTSRDLEHSCFLSLRLITPVTIFITLEENIVVGGFEDEVWALLTGPESSVVALNRKGQLGKQHLP